jgi:hypothetical protein
MSNSIGWVIAIVILLGVIIGGTYLWMQNNSNKTGATVQTILPLGGRN